MEVNKVGLKVNGLCDKFRANLILLFGTSGSSSQSEVNSNCSLINVRGGSSILG